MKTRTCDYCGNKIDAKQGIRLRGVRQKSGILLPDWHHKKHLCGNDCLFGWLTAMAELPKRFTT